MAGQAPEEGGPPFGAALGHRSDQRHEQRDEGNGDGEDPGRHPVGREDHRHHRDRNDAGEQELGEVLGEIGVEGVDPRAGQHHQVGPTGPVDAMRSELRHAVHQRVPQVRFRRGRGPVSGELGQPTQQGATGDDDQQEHQWKTELCQAPVAPDRPGDAARQQPGLRDQQQGDEATDPHGQGEESPGRPGVAEEPRIDRRGSGRTESGCHACLAEPTRRRGSRVTGPSGWARGPSPRPSPIPWTVVTPGRRALPPSSGSRRRNRSAHRPLPPARSPSAWSSSARSPSSAVPFVPFSAVPFSGSR